MNGYLLLYYTHILTVALSGSYFLLRGIWMMQGSRLLAARFVRISPHVIDTLLLLSAIGLSVMTQQYPFTHHWLTVKLLALVAYILLGVFALRRGRTPGVRKACFAGALVVFGFIVAVALTHP